MNPYERSLEYFDRNLEMVQTQEIGVKSFSFIYSLFFHNQYLP